MRYNFIITFQNQILKIQLNFSMAHFIKPFLPICLSIHLKVFLPGLEWKTINSGKILLQGVCLDRVWVQIRSHSMTSLSTQTFYQSSLFGFQKQSKRNHFILFLRLSKSCQCQIVPKPTQNFFSRFQGVELSSSLELPNFFESFDFVVFLDFSNIFALEEQRSRSWRI